MAAAQGRARTGDKKNTIYACAKLLFEAKGFKDTNVPEIAQSAGIATGTFYLYYSSKENLFMDIFMDENVKLKQSILAAVDTTREPLTVIQEIMQLNNQGILSNPILREWYNKDVFNKIEAKYREENGLEKVNFMYDAFIDVVKKWQADGKMRSDIESEMIMALFGAIIVIDQHKDEIGISFFPEIQQLLTGFVLEGLQGKSKEL
ncbi:MAG: TetR/AcrR family transcriptional regulator [Acetobacterium sp.]|jgi:AcrR family transcriptional regulator|nr:TetR/AcrR family transcriptional regulator [Acetobacterium sp.]